MDKKLNGFNDGEHASSGVGGLYFNRPIKVKVEFKHWDYTCSDGCCTDYGCYVFLNGKELEHPDSTKEDYIPNSNIGENVEETLRTVLKALGYEVEIGYIID